MNKLYLTLLAAFVWAVPGTAQQMTRQANITGNAVDGKCTIEVVVEGSAEVEVQGDVGRMRNLSGQPAIWRRFVCNGRMPPIRTTSDSAESTGEVALSFFRIRGGPGAGLCSGSTTPKVVERVTPSISNGAVQAEANGIARIRAGGADPNRLAGAAMGTGIADLATTAPGGIRKKQTRPCESAGRRSSGGSSAMVFETSLSAMWRWTTIRAGMILSMGSRQHGGARNATSASNSRAL